MAPSGEQYEIRCGALRAVLVEVGGGIRELALGDWQLLDGYGADEMCTAARGQPLMPWPNRLRDGRYRWDGQELQVSLTEPAEANALHGLVRWSAWKPAEQAADRLVMRHLLHPQPGYPFSLDLRLEYRARPRGLEVTVHAANPGSQAAPFAAGMHPYVQVGPGPLDGDELTLPAASYLPTDLRQIPTGVKPVGGTEYDFRRPRPIGWLRLDTAFAELDRDAAGRATVELRRGDRAIAVWMDERFTHVMAYSGDAMAPAARRRSLGVEPMTCPPNAFQTGEDLIRLEPGQAWSASWGIEAR